MPSGGSGDGAGGSRGGGGAARGPLIHVNTRCDSLEEFVEKFAGLASEGALVLPASGELPVGTEGRFAIRLRDQSVAMRGRCRVTGARPAPSVPARGGPRPTLLRVVLLDMEEESASMHRRLLARRRAAIPVPVPPALSEPTIVSPPRPEVTAPPPLRVPPPPPVSGRAATMIGMNPLGRSGVSAPARTLASPFVDTRASPPAETRAPGASFTLPANPLSELDATDLASFIDSTLLESDDEDATVVRDAGAAGGDDETLEQLAPPRAPEIAVEATAPTLIDSSPLRVRSPAAAKAPGETRERSEHIRAMFRRAAPYLLCTIAGIGIGRLVIHSKPKLVSPVRRTPEVLPVVERPSMPAAEERPAPPPRDPAPAPPPEAPQRTTAVAAPHDAPAGRASAEVRGLQRARRHRAARRQGFVARPDARQDSPRQREDPLRRWAC